MSTELVCPSCGCTPEDINQTHRLGCAECYTTFKEPVQLGIQKYQFGDKHAGKAPSAWTSKIKVREMEEALKKAVSEERYEDAAELQKAIAGVTDEHSES